MFYVVYLDHHEWRIFHVKLDLDVYVEKEKERESVCVWGGKKRNEKMSIYVFRNVVIVLES